jgi:surfeit locus 1 family protein
VVGLLIAASSCLVLIGLGTWQHQRKAWKEGLIAALDAQLARRRSTATRLVARRIPPRHLQRHVRECQGSPGVRYALPQKPNNLCKTQ